MNNVNNYYPILGIYLLISSLFVIPIYFKYRSNKKSLYYWFLYVYLVTFLLFLQMSIDGIYGFNDHLKAIYFDVIYVALIILAFIVSNVLLNMRNDKNEISKYKIFILTLYLFLFILFVIAF